VAVSNLQTSVLAADQRACRSPPKPSRCPKPPDLRGYWLHLLASNSADVFGAVPASVRVVSQAELISSIRQAAAACNVSAPVVRRWLTLGLIPEPPWTLKQLEEVRCRTDPEGRRRGTRAAHGTMARWNAGCSGAECRQSQSEAARIRGRARAHQRLPVEMRQQLLDAIYNRQPFRTVLRDLGLTSNQVWGLTKTDREWSEKLDTALTAARWKDLKHGTNAAYIHGCVCRECREHQQNQDGQATPLNVSLVASYCGNVLSWIVAASTLARSSSRSVSRPD
jgi:hypothetical protein